MKILALFTVVIFAACGDGGGDGGTDAGPADAARPTGDTRVVDLGASELATLCGELAAVVGGPRSVLCTDHEIDFPDEATQAAECVDDYGALPAGCAFTVAQAQGCAQAFADDACTAADDPSCMAVLACSGS